MEDKMKNSLKTYEDCYLEFCKKHGSYKEVSSLEENVTHKTLSFEDGSAIWYEISTLITMTPIEALAKLGVRSEKPIPVYRTEYWSTDDSRSRYRYEIREFTLREKIEGAIPEGIQECLIYVPSKQEVFELRVGSGDNLDKSDYDQGIVDYLDFTGFKYVGSGESDAGFVASDGGQYLTREIIKDVKSVIYDFLDFQYEKPVPIVFMHEGLI